MLAHQALDVVVDDVPAVLAQMRGDAVGAGLPRRGARRAADRDAAAARVADGRDVVDVHAKAQMMLGSSLHSLHRRVNCRARSTALMAAWRATPPMMLARCLTSATSTSITMSKKSIERLMILQVGDVALVRAITVDRLDRLPGWLATVT